MSERVIVFQHIFVGCSTLQNIDCGRSGRVPDNGPEEVLILEREVREKHALEAIASGVLKHVAVGP